LTKHDICIPHTDQSHLCFFTVFLPYCFIILTFSEDVSLASCEVELDLIDMAMRIGPRNHICCDAFISCASGISLPWVGEIRYLGIFIVRSRVFRCFLDHPKKASIVQLMPYSGKLDDCIGGSYITTFKQ